MIDDLHSTADPYSSYGFTVTAILSDDVTDKDLFAKPPPEEASLPDKSSVCGSQDLSPSPIKDQTLSFLQTPAGPVSFLETPSNPVRQVKDLSASLIREVSIGTQEAETPQQRSRQDVGTQFVHGLSRYSAEEESVSGQGRVPESPFVPTRPYTQASPHIPPDEEVYARALEAGRLIVRETPREQFEAELEERFRLPHPSVAPLTVPQRAPLAAPETAATLAALSTIAHCANDIETAQQLLDRAVSTAGAGPLDHAPRPSSWFDQTLNRSSAYYHHYRPTDMPSEVLANTFTDWNHHKFNYIAAYETVRPADRSMITNYDQYWR